MRRETAKTYEETEIPGEWWAALRAAETERSSDSQALCDRGVLVSLASARSPSPAGDPPLLRASVPPCLRGDPLTPSTSVVGCVPDTNDIHAHLQPVAPSSEDHSVDRTDVAVVETSGERDVPR